MNDHTAENDAPVTCDADGFEDQPPCASCRTVGYCQGGDTRVIPPGSPTAPTGDPT